MPVRLLALILRALSSTKLTIISVAALVVLSLLGSILPQASDFSPEELEAWKQEHLVVSLIAEPIGGFRMFSSLPFISVAILVTLNLAFNTADRIRRTRRQILSKASSTITVKAHVIIHGGLLLLTLGIALSLLFKLDGSIILTEGQIFQEGHGSYHSLREGPLFGESHRGYAIRLEEFQPTYAGDQHPVQYASRVRLAFGPGDEVEATLEVNSPVKIRGITITQDIFGYSPLISIEQDDRQIAKAFLALNTFRRPQGLRFSDFLMLNEDHRLLFEVLPDYDGNEESPGNRSPIPRNPAMLVTEERLIGNLWHAPGFGVEADVPEAEMSEETGEEPSAQVSEREGGDLGASSGEAGLRRGGTLILYGESGRVGDYVVSFSDLRYWSKFRVVQDAYLKVIYAGLWLSLAGLALRYPVAMFVRSRRT